jgi:hypothetical protein
MLYVFDGRVQFRSSVSPGMGPPGEAEILALNPERERRIRSVTGWPRLQAGSLNLTVKPDVLEALAKFPPTLVEDGTAISYPSPYAHIPKVRGAYLYYAATFRLDELSEGVLVRRARNPVPGRVELFAAISLKDTFGLSAGSQVKVEVHAA